MQLIISMFLIIHGPFFNVNSAHYKYLESPPKDFNFLYYVGSCFCCASSKALYPQNQIWKMKDKDYFFKLLGNGSDPITTTTTSNLIITSQPNPPSPPQFPTDFTKCDFIITGEMCNKAVGQHPNSISNNSLLIMVLTCFSVSMTLAICCN